MIEAALWGLVGGLALVLGALVAFELKPNRRTIAFVMAFGSGVLISAIAYDLTAEAFKLAGGDAVGIGLAAGALVYAGLDHLIERPAANKRTGADPGDGARGIALGALLDGIPESAAIGLTLLEGGGVGVAFVVAVFISNLPESISASAEFARGGRSRMWILRLWLAIAAASAASAAIGYGLLGGGSGYLQAVVDAFAGGAILTMLATSMMPKAYEQGGRSVSIGLVTVIGFAFAAALTSFA